MTQVEKDMKVRKVLFLEKMYNVAENFQRKRKYWENKSWLWEI
jgi:hypothetical protein